MGLGWSQLPTSTWITLFSVGGSRSSNRFSNWRSSYWAHGSALDVSIASSRSNWLIEVILMQRFLKSTPTLTSDCHLDELEECDRRDSSPSNWNWAGGEHIPTPCVFCHNNLLVFLLAWKSVEDHVVPFWNSSIPMLQIIPYFSHHMVCWPCIMKKLRGLWVWTRVYNCRHSGLDPIEYY